MQQDAVQKFWKMLDQHVPKQGVVEAIYASPAGRGETRIAFDFETGAWFRLTPGIVVGADVDGKVYYGDSGLGRTKFDPSADAVLEAMAVANYIPSASLFIIARRKDMVAEVRETTRGFEVHVLLPSRSGTFSKIWIETDGAAKVTRFRREGFSEEFNAELQYSAREPFLTSVVNGTDVGLRGVVAQQAGQFSSARAEGIAAQLAYNKAVAAVATEAPPGEAASNTGFAMVTAGVIFAAVAGVVFLRRRTKGGA